MTTPPPPVRLATLSAQIAEIIWTRIVGGAARLLLYSLQGSQASASSATIVVRLAQGHSNLTVSLASPDTSRRLQLDSQGNAKQVVSRPLLQWPSVRCLLQEFKHLSFLRELNKAQWWWSTSPSPSSYQVSHLSYSDLLQDQFSLASPGISSSDLGVGLDAAQTLVTSSLRL